jgi:aryl-alcohol dehydrogenase-like predicted oxidoreductase
MLCKGLEVSALGLGCMPMTGFADGAPMYGHPDAVEALATLHRAIDIGVTLFDTAEIYGQANEELLGRAISGRREGLLISTKFGFLFKAGQYLGCDGRPENARRACEQSLTRLGTDAIDLFYLHRVDPAVSIEESIGGMADLVREGKVRFLGLSEVSAETIRRAHAEHPIAAVESEYSLWERGPEESVLPALRELGIGFVPYAPLGRGFLTGTIRSRADLRSGDYRLTDPRYDEENFAANMRMVDAVSSVASAKGTSMTQVALAWLLAQGPDVVPIPGIERRQFLDDSMGAVDLELAPSDLLAIEVAAPRGSTAGARYRAAAPVEPSS